MNDSIENDIFRRMRMTNLEQRRFEITNKAPGDTVVGPLRQRTSCSICQVQFSNENTRLWHQFTHITAYDGFLEGKLGGRLPKFKFSIACPFSTCNSKFADFIDAKFHYMLAHQSCQLFCCGMKFQNYQSAMEHVSKVPQWEGGHFLSPGFLCTCHHVFFHTREEYTAHLQGKDHKCPDPICRRLFRQNEEAVTHFFNAHYKHLVLDNRKVFLNYKYFLRYLEKQEERRKGPHHCPSCHRRFNEFRALELHVVQKSCLVSSRKDFAPIVPCKCYHQFVYCFYQRDFLLRTLPILREAVEHMLREAPFNGMPTHVCDIYGAMIRVLTEVNQHLLDEKLANYQRMDPFEHTEMSPESSAQLLLGVVEYFCKIM